MGAVTVPFGMFTEPSNIYAGGEGNRCVQFTDQGRRIQHIKGAISTTFMHMAVGPQGIPNGHEILRWPEPAPVRGRVFSAWSRT